MFKKMLIPIDMNELTNSVGILPHASRVASGLNIPVVFVSVVNPDSMNARDEIIRDDTRGEGHAADIVPGAYEPLVVPEMSSGTDRSSVGHDTNSSFTQVVENEEFAVKRELNKLSATLCESNVDAESIVVVRSNVTDAILDTASDCGCDLIAVATRDRNIFSQTIKGSITNDLVRSSHVPVLAISPEVGEIVPDQSVQISSIVVPLDGTPFAEVVLPYVERVAKMMSLEVVLVRVARTSDVPPVAAGVGVAPAMANDAYTTAELNAAIEDSAVEYLDVIAKGLESRGVHVNWEFVRGALSPSIAEVSDNIPNSMIALASHGYSGVKRWVLGSVAEELIRGTGEPVLVIPSTLGSDEE